MQIVGLDARMYTYTGIGRYIRNLLRGLDRLPSRYHYLLFGDPDVLKTAGVGEHFTIRPWFSRPYGLGEQVQGLRQMGRERLTLLHVPHYNIPVLYRGALVVTIHDLIHLRFPRHVAAYAYARSMLGLAVKKARTIIANSQSTRQDILLHWEVPDERIEVIYPGVDRTVFRPLNDTARLETFRGGWGLPRPYILYLGLLKPHKNLVRLVQAFARLREDRDFSDVRLVLAGKMDKTYRELPSEIQRLDLVDWVIFAGEMTEEEVPMLYNGAGLFVLPSLWEGFGLTALEAMACGVPVVASDRGSLPEVVGDAAVKFEALETESLAGAMAEVLKHEDLREDLIARGLRRAQEFSWETTARKTLQVYDRAAG